MTALVLVYKRFVIRGHVWNILQEHFSALDWACLTKGTFSLNIARTLLETSEHFF